MINIAALNVPEAFTEMLVRMRSFLVPEDTRNGPVRSFLCPVALTITNPQQRVLTDPMRDANPFFHVMEFCWMMAGSNNIQWIAGFNKRMLEYSDDGLVQHAAYGYRWRREFMLDQVKKAIVMLKRNPNDRRVVISMWDPQLDLGHNGKDVPCNTHIYLRVVDKKLDMTVMNRSNDIIWGMLGANAVHMTFLHELIAQSAGLALGCYRAISNNAHIYESVPNFDYYMNGVPYDDDVYFRTRGDKATAHVPLLQSNETYADFVQDCENLIRLPELPTSPIRTFWMKHVGAPIAQIWWARKINEPYDLNEILADDWRIACAEWIDRRNTTVGDQQRHYYAGHARREQASQGVDTSAFQPNPVAGLDNPEHYMGTAPVEPSFVGDLSPQPPEVAISREGK
jgi:hypothetical protein